MSDTSHSISVYAANDLTFTKWLNVQILMDQPVLLTLDYQS